MKKELGKWFLDIAKYLATAGLIAPWISDSDQLGIWIFPLIGIVFILTLGIGLRILAREDVKEKNRNKNKIGGNYDLEYSFASNYDLSHGFVSRGGWSCIAHIFPL